jgi:hypothetical protein
MFGFSKLYRDPNPFARTHDDHHEADHVSLADD